MQFHTFEDSPGGALALFAEQRETLGEQFRHGPGEQFGIVGAGEPVKIVERKPAPWRAQNAQPGHAVLGIEQGAGEAESIKHFGAVFQLFKLDSAKGNACFAQGRGDGRERLAGAGQDGDAVFSSAVRGLARCALRWLLDQIDNFFDLRDRGLLLFSLCNFRI